MSSGSTLRPAATTDAGTTADFAAGPTPATKTGAFAIAEMLKAAAYADYDGSYILRVS